VGSKAFHYLDYAAATPLDERVQAAMQPYLSQLFYNPSATYAPARQVAKDLEAARARVAHWLGARPSEVVFTAGGTEANNLAIHGVMQHAQAVQADGKPLNVVVSAIEHEAVLQPAHQYACREVAVHTDGSLDMASLEQSIDEHTVLVSIMYANNEIGTIQPLQAVAQLLQSVREARRQQGNNLPLYLHTDACQAGNYLDLHAARLGVDLLTLNGGKIYGPKQSGVLYVRAGIELTPLIRGGGQESGLRSGTENVAGAIGLATALDIAQQERHQEVKRLQALQQLFIDTLQQRVLEAVIHGSRKKRLPNNIHITIPGKDNERLLLELEMRQVLAAAGSACSASNEEPSHVLRAIGLSDAEAQSSLRFSMGRQTTEHAVEAAIVALVAALKADNL